VAKPSKKVQYDTKLVAMATFLEISAKRGPDRSFAPKTLSFGEKIAKIYPVDPEMKKINKRKQNI